MEATRANTQSALNQYSGSIFIAISIISILLVMILPMPSWFLDFLLTFNITFAILILMLAVYVASPLELVGSFSIFAFSYDPLPISVELGVN